ncbi:MAG: nucleotidyl transferase AbiEii/AbiGii toxin family protein [Bacteroidota bacterium]
MSKKLHYGTVSPLLRSSLETLMESELFKDFRLVGGTALSLQRGHRMSVDIDLFTGSDYGSVDSDAIDNFLRSVFPYVNTSDYQEVGLGRAYVVGESEDNSIKLDLFYTEPFILPSVEEDGIRMADAGDIIAMKLQVISGGGRKKDFWDIHELMENYSLATMLDLHHRRYEYTHDRDQVKEKLVDFSSAEDDFDPICLRNKHWELIKLDLVDFVNEA